MNEPRILTFTVMKNEGPFILEWVAWQRLIGVDRIVVLTNDCDDGTDAILDQLDRLALVRHLPNPVEAVPPGPTITPQIAAFAYGRKLREWRDADYVFLSDVDEFPCFRGEDTSLKALMKRLDYPDVLTFCETVFGTGGVIAFEDKPVVGQFTRSSSLTPGKWKSRRGFKSIARTDPRLAIRNHRPKVSRKHAASLRWLDGSGKEFPLELRARLQKGTDSRGMFDLITLNHYALRSLESYLVKAARGQPMGSKLDHGYFRQRNQLRAENTDMLRHLPRLEDEIAWLKRDRRLADLHDASVEAHRAKIAQLKNTPLYSDLLQLVQGKPCDA